MEMRITYSDVWFNKVLLGFKFLFWNFYKPFKLSFGMSMDMDKAVILYENMVKMGIMTTFTISLAFLELRMGITWLHRDLTDEERWEYASQENGLND